MIHRYTHTHTRPTRHPARSHPSTARSMLPSCTYLCTCSTVCLRTIHKNHSTRHPSSFTATPPCAFCCRLARAVGRALGHHTWLGCGGTPPCRYPTFSRGLADTRHLAEIEPRSSRGLAELASDQLPVHWRAVHWRAVHWSPLDGPLLGALGAGGEQPLAGVSE